MRATRWSLGFVLSLAACQTPPIEGALASTEPAVGQLSQAGTILPNTQPVKVINTASDWSAPVPTVAQGTTEVEGVVSATQSGSWSVGITGTPTVSAVQGSAWGVAIENPISLADGTNVSVNALPPVNVATLPPATISSLPPVDVNSLPPVNIANTPTVNIGNWPTPTVSNTQNVNVTNTPTVTLANTAANPAIVQSIDSPARQPFGNQAHIQVGVGAHESGSTFAIPDGKRLVVEYVSAHGVVAIGETNWLRFSSVRDFFFTPTRLGPNDQVTDTWMVSQQVRLYVDGPQAGVYVERPQTQVSYESTWDITISGYLIDL
jgi:hypothetical protein